MPDLQLTLVRHTTPDVEEGICYGQTDLDITQASFEEEVALVREKLAGKQYNHVVSSPLQRCTKLAEACGYKNVDTDSRIMEYNFGEWEMKSWFDIEGDYVQNWMDNYFTLPAPGGESMNEMIDRVSDFLKDIRKSDKSKVLLFSHSGPIRIFKFLAGALKKEALFEEKLEYGSVSELIFPNSYPIL